MCVAVRGPGNAIDSGGGLVLVCCVGWGEGIPSAEGVFQVVENGSRAIQALGPCISIEI